jgi:hypothetical protein
MSVLSKASGLALESGSAVPAVGCRHFGVCHFWRGEGCRTPVFFAQPCDPDRRFLQHAMALGA